MTVKSCEKMKIIFSVDAITRPLTGIGRYAWELAKRLPGSDCIQEVIFFSNGKFVSYDELLSIGDSSPVNAARIQWRVLSTLRRGLARFPIASSAYGKFQPVAGKIRLKPYGDYLFHSPNYLLPPHDGPAIATIHDLSIFSHPEWHPETRARRLNRAIGKTLRKAAHLITDTETVRQEVIDYFSWPFDKVTAIPLGVGDTFYRREPSEIISILGKFGLIHGAYSLCVGTIEPRKNIERLIRAFEKLPVTLQQSYPLVLVGDRGWNSKGIHKTIDEGRRKGWLKYLGYVPESHLPALYSGCMAFLYPSLYEGFGLPLLEAMACGVPILTSDISCMPEVAGGAAILVDPADISSITAGIEKALTDEAWRLRAIALGLRKAESMTWDMSVQKTVEVYSRVWNGINHPG